MHSTILSRISTAVEISAPLSHCDTSILDQGCIPKALKQSDAKEYTVPPEHGQLTPFTFVIVSDSTGTSPGHVQTRLVKMAPTEDIVDRLEYQVSLNDCRTSVVEENLSSSESLGLALSNADEDSMLFKVPESEFWALVSP